MKKEDPSAQQKGFGAGTGDQSQAPDAASLSLPAERAGIASVKPREPSDLPYSSLVDGMTLGTAIVDEQGRLIYCSPSLAQLLGVSSYKTIGSPLKDFIASDDQALFQQLLLRPESSPKEAEIYLRCATGGVTPTCLSLHPLSSDKSVTGVVVTDLTLQKQEIQIAARSQRVEDAERRYMARQLHDSVGQLLVAIALNLTVIRAESQKLSPEAARLLDDNARMVDQIGDELRNMSHRLHPPLLDQIGLASALRWYVEGFAERSKIDATLDIPRKFDRLPPDMEIAVYRAVEEALTNVHRHSGSSSCSVKIERDAKHLEVEIRDSGSGIPQAGKSALSSWAGNGLCGMQERMRQLGGTLEVESSEKGTSIVASLPIRSANELSQDVA